MREGPLKGDRLAKLIISKDGELVCEVALTEVRTTIGRHPDSDVVLEHRSVSGRHAVVSRTADGLLLEDQGSTNGTFVNGKRVQRHQLTERDRIVLAVYQVAFVPDPPLAAGVDPAHIEVRSGPHNGKKLVLTKPLTTLGSPGVVVVVVSRQGDAYYLSLMDGTERATLNGQPVTKDARRLQHGDSINLAGTVMAFSVA
jgi:pSer/pThr/pTyr-binding forkhead associated (FHA) protein